MDLKHKGITWVGNVFQKFEAVCQEVDNIINQDTVKYVENQVSSASENMKKLYSGVVQGLHPVKNVAKGAVQRGRVPVNAYFKSPSHNERTTANIVVNNSSVSHGTTDQIDNWSQASYKVTFVNEEVAQVPNHSFLESNYDLPLETNDDVLLDKDLCENIKENAVNIILSGKSDGKLTDQLAFVESDASDPLSHSLRNVRSEINDTNKRPSVYDDSDLQLEDDVLLVGNNDGVMTDKDASKSSEEDTTMEYNACDSFKHIANHTACQVEVTDGEATLILDNSHLLLESSRLLEKNDDDSSDENSDEFFKQVVFMEPHATSHLKDNHLSGKNSVSKEADDCNLLLKYEVHSGRIDHPLIDKDLNESPIKDAIFEDDSNRYLLNIPSNGNGVCLTYQDAIMVSDRNNQQLVHELLPRKNNDALTHKYSNESLKKDTIWELKHDASYPLKNQPRCTSSSIIYKDEEVSSVSNASFLKLEGDIFCGKNSKALIDEASDASCKEQANLELSTELTLHCDKESNKETFCSFDKEREEDIPTPNGNPRETSIHGADVESTRKVGQTFNILVNNLVDSSLRMETTSKYLENGGYSSNARDATSSELATLVFTSRETVEETKPVSTLKSLPEVSFSASKSLVKNVSGSTAVHDKPSDQCATIDCESCPSFEVVTKASNKALEVKCASSRSSLSSMESLGTPASRGNKSAFLSKSRTCSQVEFSEPASSGAVRFSTEVGCIYNSSGFITDAEMETVDLGHTVTLKNECDIVDYKALHAVTCRTRKLRSYKKRIQDAFTSKKRLAKEYEQLAIWYGDIDLEFSTGSSQKLDKKNESTSYGSDSEWELL